MGKSLKARVIDTGKIVKVVPGHGHFEDKKTGQTYKEEELKFLPRTHMLQFGFQVWRIGFFIFGREYLKYNIWYLIPGIAVSAVKGYDRYLDIEIKLLFVGFGIRFIWVKKK